MNRNDRDHSRNQQSAEKSATVRVKGLMGASVLAAVAGLIVTILGGSVPARAGTYTYSTSTRQIRCGLLLLDSAGQTANPPVDLVEPGSFGFYVLDQRQDIKPEGWEIVNPLAPTNVTSAVNTAYVNAGVANVPTIGQPVTANMADYWWVSLPQAAASFAAGTDILKQFDVLAIHTHKLMGLSRNEREALRQFVDEGGTLWVEDCGNATTMVNDPNAGQNTPAGLITDVFFNDPAAGAGNSGFAYLPDMNHRHPLVTTPYFLTDAELNDLGDKDVANYFVSSMKSPSTQPDVNSLLISIVGNTANVGTAPFALPLPYVAAGDYGAGHVIVDNADILDDVSNPVAVSTSTAYCPSDVSAAHIEDLKFLVNLIAWASNTSSSEQGNTRRNGFERAPIPGAGILNQDWSYRITSAGATPQKFDSTGVAIEGNTVYVTGTGAAHSYLNVFDLIPGEDLNMDGFADDGDFIQGASPQPSDALTGIPFIQDWSGGQTYDELWQVVDPGGSTNSVSAPTVAYVPGGAVAAQQTGYSGTVLVEGDDGSVYAYDATCNPAASPVAGIKIPGTGADGGSFAADYVNGSETNGSLLSTAAGGALVDGYPRVAVPAPVYYHGWLIAAQPRDNNKRPRVFVYSFYQAQKAGGGYAGAMLYVDTPTGGTDLTPIVATPAVASIPSLDGTYGGSDVLCYVSTAHAVYPIFLGSRDEQFRGSPPSALTTKLAAISGAFNDPSTVGDVEAPEDAFIESTFPAFVYLNASPDWITTIPEWRGAQANASTGDITVTLAGSDSPNSFYGDYDTAAAGGFSYSRHEIDAQLDTNIAGGLSPTAGTSLMQGAAVGPDNLLYLTVNEMSGGQVYGYIAAIQEQNPQLGGQGTVVKWRFALTGQPNPNPENIADFTGFEFIGPPVVDDNRVYALAWNPTSLVARVLAFNLNAQFQLQIGQAIDSQSGIQLTADDEFNLALSGNGVHSMPASAYQLLDASNGVIDLKDFSDSLPNSTTPIQEAMTVPAPVYVQFQSIDTSTGAATGAGVAQPYAIITSAGGSPLLSWWAQPILPAAAAVNTAPSPMREMGNKLYFGYGTTANAVQNGQANVYVVNTDVTIADGSELPNSGASTDVQNFFCDGGQITTGLAASGTNVVAASSSVTGSTNGGGVAGLGYDLTLIADNNRLLEIDPNGNAVWAMDSTQEMSYVGGPVPTTDTEAGIGAGIDKSSRQVSLSRPSSVTKLATNDILFADTGNNRCVRVNHAGQVQWELTSFSDPTGLLGSGQPLTLNHPTSIIVWRESVIDHATADSVPGATNTNGNWIKIVDHYLICDSGNHRVLLIDDIFTNGQYATPATDYHVLHWVSHTGDIAGRAYSTGGPNSITTTGASRQYDYISADKFTDLGGNVFIVAAVSNRRVAPLVQDVMGNMVLDSLGNPMMDVPGKDSDGSSVVYLKFEPTPDYDPAATPTTGGGSKWTSGPLTGQPVVPVYAGPPVYSLAYQLWPDPGNGLPGRVLVQTQPTIVFANGVMSTVAYGPAGNPTIKPLRNLHYLTTYVPQNASYYSVLIADDDGVFDGPVNQAASPNTIFVTPFDLYLNSTTGGTTTGFSYTVTDYDSPLGAIRTNDLAPAGVFSPVCAQKLGDGNYLITNAATVGDSRVADSTAGSGPYNDQHFGGNVFEVVASTKVAQGVVLGHQVTSAATGLTGPLNTAPLAQPASASRQ